MKKRLLTLTLALLLVFTAFAGCQSREEPSEPESSSSMSSSSRSSSSQSISSLQPLPKPEGKTIADATKEMDKTKDVQEKKKENSDTVAWLTIPELGIDEVIVCNLGKVQERDGAGNLLSPNKYYERRNFAKQNSFNGVVYADYRNTFGAGAASELSINTVLYGHAMTDKPDRPNYEIFFGHLHDLREEEHAKDTPYIFLSTEKESLAFEIVSVAFPNTTTESAPYNTTDYYTHPEFVKFIKEVMMPRSLWDFDAEIKDDDKFITLSTCAYNLPDGTPTNYGSTTNPCWYRYAIVGRLCKPDEELKTAANVTKNADMIQDDNQNHTAEKLYEKIKSA